MADETWTLVGRRRGARIRRSLASVAPLVQTEECDTSLLLLRLKRSVARVQESAFFQRFLLQMQSAPVCDLLSRAASTSRSQSLQPLRDDVVLEHNVELQRDAFSEGFDQDISPPMKSLTTENAVDSFGASLLSALGDAVGECVQNVPEAGASDATSKTLIGTNSVAMECMDGLCRDGFAGDAACSTSAIENTECWHLDVVLYGLGSIANSEVSRCQLALILLLKERFSWVGIIEVYDPVLTLSECTVIKDMGCLPVALNEKGRRSIVRPTLFYMPHCEDWLYDNVLQANWAPCTLRQIVILGNSFQDYQERWSSSGGRKPMWPSYVLKYQQLAKEVPLEANHSLDLAGFNNMSWHFYDLCSSL
ncbi:hypothetical protein GOP47_0006745 [Adiantum capillus-veneris]|uniref:SRR1-like domain-containing protein n=1 Tax=Adiantum capillus-veneris TaxID=13818 RepID=A0A9D4ZKQ4_ADICA|nr:hypothetical protein GOP47_0006745 [Adiantum capillus-veneris]